MTRIAITGASGRMGRRLVALAKESGRYEIVGAFVRAGNEFVGRDAGDIAGVGAIGVPIATELRASPGASPQVLIDFTSPAATRHWIEVCRGKRVAMLIGSTGLQIADHKLIDEAAREIAILQATNTSLGVAVLNKLVADAARMLGAGYDIEILEAHHRHKKDAPSGTAITLAETLLAATGRDKSALRFDRHESTAARAAGEIGMQSLRMGDEVGRHTVYFASTGERLEFTHRASTRDTFAHGALRAAEWLATKPAGRYSFADMLGI